jgi:L-ascorbate metabolism protein UlaG (beta-lactamase superfamily)
VSQPDGVTYVGHATVLLRLAGMRFLTDPLLTERLIHLRRQVPLALDALAEPVDAVLISHLHHDHLHVASLRRIDRRATMVVPRGAGRIVGELGFHDVRELEPGDAIEVGAVTVTAVHAEHDDRRHPGGPHAPPLGYVLQPAGATGADLRWWFAGDTDVHDGMQDLAPLDLALVPVWGWGPTLGDGHMDPVAAARAVALVRARQAIPIHWGTYFPTGLAGRYADRLRDPPHEFVRWAAELAPACTVSVLAPGESLSLGG